MVTLHMLNIVYNSSSIRDFLECRIFLNIEKYFREKNFFSYYFFHHDNKQVVKLENFSMFFNHNNMT